MAKTGAIKAGRAYVELGTDDSKMAAGFRKASYRLKAFSASVTATGMKMTAAGVAFAAPLLMASKVFMTMGDNLAKMSARTGLGVKGLSALAFAADRSGTDLASLENGLRRMQRTLYDAGRGLSTATDALKDLGLTVKHIKALAPEGQFRLLAEQLHKVTDPTRKAALAMMIFGRAGTALLPMFERGRAGLDEYTAAAQRLGVIVSDESAAAAAELTDCLGDLKTVAKMAAFQIGAALAGDLKKCGKVMTEVIAEIVRWIKANQKLIKSWAVGILKAAAWTAGIGVTLIVVGKLIVVIGGLTKAIAFLAAHPVVAVFVGITLAAAGTAIAIQRLTKHVADYSSKAKEAADAGMKLRAEHFKQMERLKELAGKARLNNDEMIEARRLIKELTGHYGDLGIKLGDVSGKLEGVATAHDKVVAAMRRAAIFEAEARLIELEQNLAEAAQATLEPGFMEELRRAGLRLLRSVTDTKKAWNELDGAQQAEARAYQARLQMTLAGIAAYQARLKALRAGGVGALVPEAGAPEPKAPPLPLGTPATWADLSKRFANFGADALNVIDNIKLAWLDCFAPLTDRQKVAVKSLADAGKAITEDFSIVRGMFEGRIAGLGGHGLELRTVKATEKSADTLDKIHRLTKELVKKAKPFTFA